MGGQYTTTDFKFLIIDFLKKDFFSNDFPARPLSNGVTIVVIAVLEEK